jgi:two-component sensor histidine kinase
VEHVFAVHQCQELRHETEDGRIWVRMAIPLHAPTAGRRMAWLPRPPRLLVGESLASDAVLVLLHNATEAVQKQRELNVKSAIIQEVHHRVKNNLQNIAAILRIQARRVESAEARQQLNDAVNRVMSMSVIHEFLSQDEDRTINVRDVCQRIATQVKQVAVDPEQEIAIQVSGSGIRLPASQATPAALVINELILNAVEHGLRDRRRGTISITLNDLGDAVHLVVEDDGIGLPPDFDPSQQQASLGLQIVQTLVTDDLKGAFRMESVTQDAAAGGEGNGAVATEPRTGARAVVTFPKRNPRLD